MITPSTLSQIIIRSKDKMKRSAYGFTQNDDKDTMNKTKWDSAMNICSSQYTSDKTEEANKNVQCTIWYTRHMT